VLARAMTKTPSKKVRKATGGKVSAVRRQSAIAVASRARAAGGLLKESVLPADTEVAALALELGRMIEAARQRLAYAANAALTTLYWQLGERVRTEVLDGRRAAYGARIVAALGRQLDARYGRGFGDKNLRRMVQFAVAFPDPEIVAALGRQLGWAHFRLLIPLKEPLKRAFYAEMCRVEGWSTRTLAQKIDGMLFERTALSKKPEHVIRRELAALHEKGELTPSLVFQDPYMLDFLELKDTYSEKHLESALLREIERFLLELGAGFAFVERQKRIIVDGDDYYIDLLFFHRRMRRLVAIELKLGDFKPADSGQVELYLRWLDRHERQPTEEAPLGIILCAGKKRETVEYLDLDARGIHVAEYLTELPPREVLQERLHRALASAKSRLASAATDDESDAARIGHPTRKSATTKRPSKRGAASRGKDD
jgi:predicted nuclease of restriction endonuclease-like (RecB) superfamily